MIPSQSAYEPAPLRTAAELGFDDSRYGEVPDDLRDLDPVGRSLMREERRAALEAQAHTGDDRPLFRDEIEAAQGPDPYEQQQTTYAPAQPAYDDRQQQAYEDPSSVYAQGQQTYDEQPQNGSYNDSFFAPQDGYASQDTYAEPVQETYSAFGSGPRRSSQQDDWPTQDSYQEPYRSEHSAQAESAQRADAGQQERVGFDPHGPAAPAGPPRPPPVRSPTPVFRCAVRAGSSARPRRRRRRPTAATTPPRTTAAAATAAAPTTGVRPTTSAGSARSSSEAQGRRSHLLRSAAPGAQGQLGRGHGGIDPAGRPPGLPRA